MVIDNCVGDSDGSFSYIKYITVKIKYKHDMLLYVKRDLKEH